MKLYKKEQLIESIETAIHIITGNKNDTTFSIDDWLYDNPGISLPSDEEIEKEINGHYQTPYYNNGFMLGAKWVIDKIKNQQ